jgi:hypothetical protein
LVDSTQGSNALGFFLGQALFAPRGHAQPGRIIRRPKNNAPHAAGNAMTGSARPSKPPRPRTSKDELGLASYLQKILTARVYDVAIESPLDLAKNLSKRLGNQVWLKREDTQPCSASSCAAPTTRCPPERRPAASAA